MAYEHLLSIPPLISPPWGFVNLLPRVILSCAVHRDNFLILPVPRQSSDSFVSIVREIVYRTLKQTGDPDGFRNSTRYECLKCGRGWESCFFASLLGTNEDWNKRRQLIGSTFCLEKKKKKLKKVVAIRERILWENCINIIIVSRNFFPNPKRRYFDSIWISILIKAKNYWHWSIFEMEVSSVQSITIMRIFFRGIGYLSNVYYS